MIKSIFESFVFRVAYRANFLEEKTIYQEKFRKIL